MKNIVKLSVLVLVFALTSCKKNNVETKSTTTENSSEQLYSCPMHPEETGEKDASCSVCGMKLTEVVK